MCKYPSEVAYKLSSSHASCSSGILFLDSVEPYEFIPLLFRQFYCVRFCEAGFLLDGRRLSRLSFKCRMPTTSEWEVI